MSDILDRLRKRIYPAPALFTAAGGGNACAAVSTVIPGPSGTFTVGGPDKDVQEAIAEIERLRGVISDVTNERDLLVRSINTPIADVRTENYRLKLERDQLVSMDNAAMDKMQAMIREQSERIVAVASYAELLVGLLNGARAFVDDEAYAAKIDAALSSHYLQGASIREDEGEAHDARPSPKSGDIAGPAACREISAGLTTQPPDHFVHETGRDWPEGDYQCECFKCGQLFTGHKRSQVCKLCSAELRHQSCHQPGSLPPRFKKGDGSFEDWYEGYFAGCTRPNGTITSMLRHAFEAGGAGLLVQNFGHQVNREPSIERRALESLWNYISWRHCPDEGGNHFVSAAHMAAMREIIRTALDSQSVACNEQRDGTDWWAELKKCEDELRARGVKDVKFAWSPTAGTVPSDQLARDVVLFLRACLDGRVQAAPPIGDSIGLRHAIGKKS